jgi:hypothetical protein
VTFDRAMDPSTLSATSFTLACPAGTTITGIVSYDTNNRSAAFTPTASLPGDVTCSATLHSGIKDTQGVALAISVAGRSPPR